MLAQTVDGTARGLIELTPRFGSQRHHGLDSAVEEDQSTFGIDWQRDRLLDRLHDPSGGLLLQLNGAASNIEDIPGSSAGDPDVDPGDNTGFTVASYNTIRRPNWPAGGGLGFSNAQRGVLPPWAIDFNRINGTISWNIQDETQSPRGNGSCSKQTGMATGSRWPMRSMT